MPAAVVQRITLGYPSAGDDADTFTFPNPVVNGNAILVLLPWSYPGCPPSFTDNQGNTYTSKGTQPRPSSPGGEAGAFFLFTAKASASGTLTLTLHASCGFANGLYAVEASGLADNPYDGQNTATSTTNPATTGSVTPTAAGALLLGFLYNPTNSGSGFTVAGGWTTEGTPAYGVCTSLVQGTAAAVASTVTDPQVANNCYGYIAAFKASTVAAGPATQIAVNAGNNQSAAVATAVPTALSVIVRDAANLPVAGHSITFAVASGGGQLASGTTVVTNASGIATAPAFTLGTAAGTNTVTATAAGLTGSPVLFTATGTAGAATTIAKVQGDNQTPAVASLVPVPPRVLATDTHGNPKAGVTVTFAVASGGGSATGLVQVTDAAGLATVSSWTTGPAPGVNTLTATATGLAGSPLTFTATTGTAAPLPFLYRRRK